MRATTHHHHHRETIPRREGHRNTSTTITITQTKLLASALGITKIEAADRGGSLDFADATQVDPLALVKLVQAEPHIYRLVGGTRLRFDTELVEFEERYQFVQQLLQKISPASSAAVA